MEPAEILDMGNSGTAARLLMGVLASHPLTAFLTGDESLRRRPMARVQVPLERFGAQIVARSGGRTAFHASAISNAAAATEAAIAAVTVRPIVASTAMTARRVPQRTASSQAHVR